MTTTTSNAQSQYVERAMELVSAVVDAARRDGVLRQTKLRPEAEAVLRAHLESSDAASLLRLVADIRFAVGDDGKRMQGELLEFLKALRKAAALSAKEPQCTT